MHAQDSHGAWPPMVVIPAPMAFFGILAAFIFGATVGVMASKKHEMMGGKGGWGMHGPGMRGKRWMKSHHHHGYGMPPCMDPECCGSVEDAEDPSALDA